MSGILKVARALDYAARKHAGHRRKGEAKEPYINHLAEVACLVAEATDGTDTDLVVAALLHDTIEDTGVTADELASEFGRDVADIVLECTDDKSLPKTERKRLQAETAPQKSERARLLKIADKTSNLRSILSSPPSHWDLARKQAYFEWAASVVAGCRGLNARLEAAFDREYARRDDVR